MILEKITEEILYGPAVLIISTILIIVGAIIYFSDNPFPSSFKSMWKFIPVVSFLIGIVGVAECIHSASKKVEIKKRPIMRIETFPVEFRSENNKLYVFKNEAYTKVSQLTSEFVAKDDTLFIYHYETIGAKMSWGTDSYIVLKKRQNIFLIDSLQAVNDKIMLDINPAGGFIARKDSTDNENH